MGKLKVVADFRTLLTLARTMADAIKSGDPEAIEKATKEHNEYKQICLDADEMSIGFTRGALSAKQ